jgi:hypothetical protein
MQVSEAEAIDSPSDDDFRVRVSDYLDELSGWQGVAERWCRSLPGHESTFPFFLTESEGVAA